MLAGLSFENVMESPHTSKTATMMTRSTGMPKPVARESRNALANSVSHCATRVVEFFTHVENCTKARNEADGLGVSDAEANSDHVDELEAEFVADIDVVAVNVFVLE